jgi:basic membrane protein A
MSISLSKRTFVSALALAGITMYSQAADPVKVGFVFFGTPGDGGWTYAHSIAVKEAQKVLGNKIAVTIVEDVPENADAERVIRDLASKGNQYIFTTSFGYMEQTLKVGKSFPKVEFYHNTGFKSAPNVHIYNSRMYEPAYLAGIIAGRMTKTNTLGYVASFPIPEVVRNINAYTMGARSVNPNVKTKVVWISSWYDPAKERQAAETLIGQGADMLLQNTDSTATMQSSPGLGHPAVGELLR